MRVERARYFLAAVRTGSLRSAAADCGVSQPALGQQLTMLEEELDVVLLTRTRRGVRPTPAGLELVEPLRRLVAAEDAVRGVAIDTGARYQGRVLIGGGSVTVESIVAPVVGALREQHPGLRFGVREGPSHLIETAVGAGDLDLAVVTTPAMPPPPGVERTTLLAATLAVQVPLGHPLATRPGVRWADLAAWPVVSMREGTVLWQVLRDALPACEPVVQAMSARTVRVMVGRGIGVGVLAEVGPSDVAGLASVPIDDAGPVSVSLVQRHDTQPSRAALIVRRLIREHALALA